MKHDEFTNALLESILTKKKMSSKYLLLLLIIGLVSCESDDRVISVYTLKFCDDTPSEMVYCASQFGASPIIDTWKQAVPIFRCRNLNDNYFSKLNVCDTILVSRTVTGELL